MQEVSHPADQPLRLHASAPSSQPSLIQQVQRTPVHQQTPLLGPHQRQQTAAGSPALESHTHHQLQGLQTVSGPARQLRKQRQPAHLLPGQQLLRQHRLVRRQQLLQ